MREERCTVCGRTFTRGLASDLRPEYEIIFHSVCELCGVTLGRAMEGITEMLRQSHGERRERILHRLMQQLKGHGFDVDDEFSRRRRVS